VTLARTEELVRERPRRGRSRARPSLDRLTPFLMIAPSVALVAVFVYGFIGYSGFSSLTRWNSVLPDYTFVGLRQYRLLLDDARFQADVHNTVVFTVCFLVLSIVLGFAAALLLDQKLPATRLFQNVYLFPLALSFVVTGVVWRWLWNPTYGIDALLRALHVDPARTGLGVITDTRTALYAVVVAATWQMSGFCMAMFLAGLRGVPDELREAARVDGATGAQALWYVILPQLNPIVLSAIIILGHISLKIFDLVYVMTFGGPGHATDMPGLYMFIAIFQQNLYAYGAAIATVLLLIVAVLVVPYLVWNLREEAAR
jgi:glucose/mannose transport system permease protein